MGVNERGGRLIGYARVSTLEQNLDMQIEALLKEGVHKNHLHREKMSATATKRPILALVLKSLRQDDTLIVWKWDRLARAKAMREFGLMVTGGSSSVPDLWHVLPLAAATARAQLLGAASLAWKLPVAERWVALLICRRSHFMR